MFQSGPLRAKQEKWGSNFNLKANANDCRHLLSVVPPFLSHAEKELGAEKCNI